MNSFLGFIVGLLQTTLSLLGVLQQHPEIPADQQQQVQQVAEQVITRTHQAVGQSLSASPSSGSAPMTVTFVSDAANVGHAINFGDGASGDLSRSCDAEGPCVASIDHEYPKVGTYVAQLYNNGTCAPEIMQLCDMPAPRVIASTTVYVSSTTQAVSVPGMTKYTDSDFGFSFWYPSGWTIKNEISIPWSAFGGELKDELTIRDSSGTPVIHVDKVYSENRSITDTGGAGPFGPVRYYFDTNLHAWMKECPEGCPDGSPSGPKAADISQNTMGGLHLFDGTSRFDTSIVPLSAHNFVVTSDGGGANASFLAKTIVATDPSVATPISALYQKSTIQAEKDAYTPSPPPVSANSSASVSVEKVDGPNVSVNYSNLPTRSYINLLWQDEGGHYEATGSQTIVQQGGNGSTILSMSPNGPSGYFIVQVRNMDDMNWHADSDQFVYGSPEAAINCTLKATPSSVKMGQYVVLTWTSLGAGHATFKQDSAAQALGLPYTDVNADGTQTFRVIAPPETISPTLYVSRDTLTGSCSTTITIN
jgi:hypothetical protein